MTSTAKIIEIGPLLARKEILTPESPRWEAFLDALDNALGRNGCDGDEGQAAPGRVHRHAKAVMAAMGGIDIEATLAFFEDHGGYCDCEILLNVDRGPSDPNVLKALDAHEKEANRLGAEFYNFGWSSGDYGDWFVIASKTSRGRFSTSRHAETGEVEHLWHDVE